MIELLIVVLAVSLIGNFYFAFVLASIRRRGPPEGTTLELKEFLKDLLSGDGLVQVRRVPPEDVLIRSPRTRK